MLQTWARSTLWPGYWCGLRGSLRALGAPLLEYCPPPSRPLLHQLGWDTGFRGGVHTWGTVPLPMSVCRRHCWEVSCTTPEMPLTPRVMGAPAPCLWRHKARMPRVGTAGAGIPWPGSAQCPMEARGGPGAGGHRSGMSQACVSTQWPPGPLRRDREAHSPPLRPLACWAGSERHRQQQRASLRVGGSGG